MSTEQELRLEVENLDLRRLLAQAGIDAAEQKGLERVQRVLLEELHHRVKNTLAIVIAITSQSLRTADSLDHGRQAVTARLIALGRVHDLLLQTSWTSTGLDAILKNATEPFDTSGTGRFFVQSSDIEVGSAAVLVPLGDAEEAARQLVALADDPDERHRLQEAGRRQSATWPDEDDVVNDLVAVYNDVNRDRRYKGFWNDSGGFTVR